MQNKLSSIGTELEEDRCKVGEMQGLNDTEKFTSRVLYPCWASTHGVLRMEQDIRRPYTSFQFYAIKNPVKQI